MYFAITLILALIIWLGLASVGRQFWIHRKYAEILIKLFEYGRKRIEKVNSVVKQQRKRKLSKIQERYEEEEEEDEEDDDNDVFDEKTSISNILKPKFNYNYY
jgi:hypothetical protein